MDEQDDGLWDPPSDPVWETEFLRALGYLLVQSNMLEDALVDVYRIVTDKDWDAVHQDVRGKALGPLRAIVVAAYEARFPDGDLRRRLEDLKSIVDKAIDTRNEFVHASWTFDPAKKLMHRRRLPRQRGTGEELRRLTVADVEAAIEIVGGAAERVWEELYDPAEVATRPATGPRNVS